MYVYILRSIKFPDQIYIGKTSNLRQRIAKHNEGGNPSTSRYKPWKFVWFSWFESEVLATDFELYLKTGSSFAFRKKRLVK